MSTNSQDLSLRPGSTHYLPALPEPESKLTPIQQAFVNAYLSEEAWLNGTQAYLCASPDCDDATASTQASRMLRLPKIRDAINDRLSASHLAPTEVLAELSIVGRSKDWKSAGHISSAKLKALELVGKAHGLFVDRSETKSTVDLQVSVNIERIEAVIEHFSTALGLARDVAIAELARAGTLSPAHVKALAAAEQTITIQAEPTAVSSAPTPHVRNSITFDDD